MSSVDEEAIAARLTPESADVRGTPIGWASNLLDLAVAFALLQGCSCTAC